MSETEALGNLTTQTASATSDPHSSAVAHKPTHTDLQMSPTKHKKWPAWRIQRQAAAYVCLHVCVPINTWLPSDVSHAGGVYCIRCWRMLHSYRIPWTAENPRTNMCQMCVCVHVCVIIWPSEACVPGGYGCVSHASNVCSSLVLQLHTTRCHGNITNTHTNRNVWAALCFS